MQSSSDQKREAALYCPREMGLWWEGQYNISQVLYCVPCTLHMLHQLVLTILPFGR